MAPATAGAIQPWPGRGEGQDACIQPAAMNDHQLGSQLRRQILADQDRGQALDGRRLQALVGDLCGDSQLALLPALKYLVMSAAFSSAAAQRPPLPSDARLQLRLQQELDQVFTPAICQRMGSVLRGLLALPDALTATSPAPPAAIAAAPPPPMPSAAPQRQSSRSVVALLGFMAGVLVVGVLAGLAWLMQQNRLPQTAAPQAPAVKPEAPATTAEPPAAPEPPPAPELQAADPQAAISTVQQLYTAIAAGQFDSARQLFSPAAADQFDPSFFSQFRQVTISDLRETGSNGTSVTLSGVVTFLYPDGTSQSESRSFSVDTASQPALITGSSFGAVLKTRN